MIQTKHRTFFRRLMLFLVSLILGVNIYQWNAENLVGNRLPMPFGYGAGVVLSGSMEPALSVNDLIFIRETKEVSPGDIIVYQTGDELIIHRVLSVDDATVTTRGDANSAADDPIALSEIKGRLIGRIPYLGGLVRILKTPAGIVLVLAAALLLLELSYRRERVFDRQQEEEIREEIRRLKEEG